MSEPTVELAGECKSCEEQLCVEADHVSHEHGGTHYDKDVFKIGLEWQCSHCEREYRVRISYYNDGRSKEWPDDVVVWPKKFEITVGEEPTPVVEISE